MIAPALPHAVVSPRIMVAVTRAPEVCIDALRYATARLTIEQRAVVEADARLRRLFIALDVLGPKGAPCVGLASDIGEMSVATLWRLFEELLGSTYFQFLRDWRLDVADALGRARESDLPQRTVAARCGLGNRARLRGTYLSCRGCLPSGRVPTADRIVDARGRVSIARAIG